MYGAAGKSANFVLREEIVFITLECKKIPYGEKRESLLSYNVPRKGDLLYHFYTGNETNFLPPASQVCKSATENYLPTFLHTLTKDSFKTILITNVQYKDKYC